jgi:hypothetical protein
MHNAARNKHKHNVNPALFCKVPQNKNIHFFSDKKSNSNKILLETSIFYMIIKALN